MSNAQSTDGLNAPWHYAAYEPDVRAFGVYVADRNGRRVCHFEGSIDQKEELTDQARLIAAAPELLTLAKKLASECAECEGKGRTEAEGYYPGATSYNDCPDCRDIHEVIAKAEGCTRG